MSAADCTGQDPGTVLQGRRRLKDPDTVGCENADGASVSNEFCLRDKDLPKFKVSQPCRHVCREFVVREYRDWGTCSALCGGGSQEALVTAFWRPSGDEATDADFTDQNVDRYVEQSCNDQACLEYEWMSLCG